MPPPCLACRPPTRPAFRWPPRPALAACGLAALLAAAPAGAVPHLRCEIEQGSDLYHLDVVPTDDPYRPQAIDIGPSFRFKAVVIGSATTVDYVKLYTYYYTPRQPVLLHQATYLSPQPLPAPGPHALTGWQDIHSPRLGRQLRYGCALHEVTP